MTEKKPLKAGVIRCQQTEDICPGSTDFKVLPQGKLAAQEVGPVEIVGFVSCGGCPGKRAVNRARVMVDRGVKVLFLASCMKKGNPIGFPCPHFDAMCQGTFIFPLFGHENSPTLVHSGT